MRWLNTEELMYHIDYRMFSTFHPNYTTRKKGLVIHNESLVTICVTQGNFFRVMSDVMPMSRWNIFYNRFMTVFFLIHVCFDFVAISLHGLEAEHINRIRIRAECCHYELWRNLQNMQRTETCFLIKKQ